MSGLWYLQIPPQAQREQSANYASSSGREREEVERDAPEGDEVDAVVGEEGQGGESGRLLSTVLASGSSEESTELSDERTRGPEAAGLVEELRDLGRSSAVSSRETEAVTLSQRISTCVRLGQEESRVGTHRNPSNSVS